MNQNYLESVIDRFEYTRKLGNKTLAQIPDNKIDWKFDEESNSIGTIVKHLWGNMLSRWTDFLSSDGEKEWRQRDAEFVNDITTRKELEQKWNEGWDCLLNTLKSLRPSDLEKRVLIRNESQTVVEAINRQLAHYSYHIGQMVFLGKMIVGKDWKSLSIPKGKSDEFNKKMFAKG